MDYLSLMCHLLT